MTPATQRFVATLAERERQEERQRAASHIETSDRDRDHAQQFANELRMQVQQLQSQMQQQNAAGVVTERTQRQQHEQEQEGLRSALEAARQARDVEAMEHARTTNRLNGMERPSVAQAAAAAAMHGGSLPVPDASAAGLGGQAAETRAPVPGPVQHDFAAPNPLDPNSAPHASRTRIVPEQPASAPYTLEQRIEQIRSLRARLVESVTLERAANREQMRQRPPVLQQGSLAGTPEVIGAMPTPRDLPPVLRPVIPTEVMRERDNLMATVRRAGLMAQEVTAGLAQAVQQQQMPRQPDMHAGVPVPAMQQGGPSVQTGMPPPNMPPPNMPPPNMPLPPMHAGFPHPQVQQGAQAEFLAAPRMQPAQMGMPPPGVQTGMPPPGVQMGMQPPPMQPSMQPPYMQQGRYQPDGGYGGSLFASPATPTPGRQSWQPGMAQPGMAQPGMAQPGMAQPAMQPGGQDWLQGPMQFQPNQQPNFGGLQFQWDPRARSWSFGPPRPAHQLAALTAQPMSYAMEYGDPNDIEAGAASSSMAPLQQLSIRDVQSMAQRGMASIPPCPTGTPAQRHQWAVDATEQGDATYDQIAQVGLLTKGTCDMLVGTIANEIHNRLPRDAQKALAPTVRARRWSELYPTLLTALGITRDMIAKDAMNRLKFAQVRMPSLESSIMTYKSKLLMTMGDAGVLNSPMILISGWFIQGLHPAIRPSCASKGCRLG